MKDITLSNNVKSNSLKTIKTRDNFFYFVEIIRLDIN